MKRLLVFVLLVSAVAYSEKVNQATTSELQAITERGRELAAYDVASWHATDAVLATKPPDGEVKRYLARRNGTGWVVGFGRLDDARSKFLLVYEATQGASPTEFVVKRYDPPQEDSTWLGAALAVDLALKNFPRPSRSYNTAVLPQPDGNLFVYLYPAQVKDDVYPLGGDVRFTITRDGGHILETRQMHKTILENSPNRNSVAGFHTHVLSQVPEDTDVFHVLSQNPPLPEYIGIPDAKFIYVVNKDGSIVVTKK